MKTYTVELTELEAKVLRALTGSTADAGEDGKTVGSVLREITAKLPQLEYSIRMGGNVETERAVMALSRLPHGQSVETSIPLSPQYTAVPKQEGVQVGCTLIPWEKVEEVMKHKPIVEDKEWRTVNVEEARRLYHARTHEVRYLHRDNGEPTDAGSFNKGRMFAFDGPGTYQVRKL